MFIFFSSTQNSLSCFFLRGFKIAVFSTWNCTFISFDVPYQSYHWLIGLIVEANFISFINWKIDFSYLYILPLNEGIKKQQILLFVHMQFCSSFH